MTFRKYFAFQVQTDKSAAIKIVDRKKKFLDIGKESSCNNFNKFSNRSFGSVTFLPFRKSGPPNNQPTDEHAGSLGQNERRTTITTHCGFQPPKTTMFFFVVAPFISKMLTQFYVHFTEHATSFKHVSDALLYG